MFVNKLFCRLVSSLILLMIVLLPYSAFAEINEFTAIGEYNMEESESLAVGQDHAVYNAMQNLLEQVEVHLENYDNNSQLSKYETNMITCEIIKVIDKKFDIKLNDTGKGFIKVTITCTVDKYKIPSMINKLKIERLKKQKEEQLAKAVEERNREEKALQDLIARSKEIEEMLISRKNDKLLNPLIIGDSSSKVLKYYGNPERINRTVTKDIVYEQWVYGNRKYIYIENDLVVAWQD